MHHQKLKKIYYINSCIKIHKGTQNKTNKHFEDF